MGRASRVAGDARHGRGGRGWRRGHGRAGGWGDPGALDPCGCALRLVAITISPVEPVAGEYAAFTFSPAGLEFFGPVTFSATLGSDADRREGNIDVRPRPRRGAVAQPRGYLRSEGHDHPPAPGVGIRGRPGFGTGPLALVLVCRWGVWRGGLAGLPRSSGGAPGHRGLTEDHRQLPECRGVSLGAADPGRRLRIPSPPPTRTSRRPCRKCDAWSAVSIPSR